MRTYILPFEKISKNDTKIAGGKGASLGEMIQVGMPVPPGFVILSGAFEHFMNESGLVQKVRDVLEVVNLENAETVEKSSREIQRMILEKEVPANVAREVNMSFENLNSRYVAVRSSATSEDSVTAAWAGQLDSFLNTTQDDLVDNIRRCWSSLFTSRAIFYRLEKGLRDQDINVAVVVQKMINSEKSGIAFSVNPITENNNQIIIEAGLGLGEAIVSGQVTPDSYIVSKNPREIVDIRVATQNRGLYRKEQGGNQWKELGEEGERQALSEGEIADLSDIIESIEKHYGIPQDIEWAYENGQFFIVQSRPITTISK